MVHRSFLNKCSVVAAVAAAISISIGPLSALAFTSCSCQTSTSPSRKQFPIRSVNTGALQISALESFADLRNNVDLSNAQVEIIQVEYAPSMHDRSRRKGAKHRAAKLRNMDDMTDAVAANRPRQRSLKASTAGSSSYSKNTSRSLNLRAKHNSKPSLSATDTQVAQYIYQMLANYLQTRYLLRQTLSQPIVRLELVENKFTSLLHV